MTTITPDVLVMHGLHLGHKKQRTHPRAKQYIYKIDNSVAIIDLFKTHEKLSEALEFIKTLGKEGKTLLIVASKKTARDYVTQACKDAQIAYITNKWVGGFLTNFQEVKKNIERLKSLQQDQKEGAWEALPKHEQTALGKKMGRIASIYGGVAVLEKLPDALFVIDIKKERNATKEATDLSIPTVAVVDTNCDPDSVTYPIPANDDAVASITFLTDAVVNAYIEGKKSAEKQAAKNEEKKKGEEKN